MRFLNIRYCKPSQSSLLSLSSPPPLYHRLCIDVPSHQTAPSSHLLQNFQHLVRVDLQA